MKLIESTPEYNIFVDEYEGTKQVMRFWRDSEIFEIKFTDEFAMANGYKDRVTMAIETGVYEYLCAFYGGLPEWLHLKDGEYTFTIPNHAASLN